MATPAAPAATPPASVAPFLTPAQQNAQIRADAGYGYNLNALNSALTDAYTNQQTGTAADARAAAIATSVANQNAAARGIFNSSINKTDLSDINTTQAVRDNLLQTSYNRMVADTNAKIGRLNTEHDASNQLYSQMAVGNAQSVTPSVGPAAPAPAAPTASAPVPATVAAVPATSAVGGQPPGTPTPFPAPTHPGLPGAWGSYQAMRGFTGNIPRSATGPIRVTTQRQSRH